MQSAFSPKGLAQTSRFVLKGGACAHLKGLMDAKLDHVAHSASDDVHAYPRSLVCRMARPELRHNVCSIQTCTGRASAWHSASSTQQACHSAAYHCGKDGGQLCSSKAD